MSILSLADFNGGPPGRCSDWLETVTVTAQGTHSRLTRRARGRELPRSRPGDHQMATRGDFYLATSGDFFMAVDTGRAILRVVLDELVPAVGTEPVLQLLRTDGLTRLTNHGAPPDL